MAMPPVPKHTLSLSSLSLRDFYYSANPQAKAAKAEYGEATLTQDPRGTGVVNITGVMNFFLNATVEHIGGISTSGKFVSLNPVTVHSTSTGTGTLAWEGL